MGQDNEANLANLNALAADGSRKKLQIRARSSLITIRAKQIRQISKESISADEISNEIRALGVEVFTMPILTEIEMRFDMLILIKLF